MYATETTLRQQTENGRDETANTPSAGRRVRCHISGTLTRKKKVNARKRAQGKMATRLQTNQNQTKKIKIKKTKTTTLVLQERDQRKKHSGIVFVKHHEKDVLLRKTGFTSLLRQHISRYNSTWLPKWWRSVGRGPPRSTKVKDTHM